MALLTSCIFRRGAASASSMYQAPNLKRLLVDEQVTKLFHFARFDVGMLRRWLGVSCGPVYCTKIASRLVRTYTDRHGLKDLCREMLGVELRKGTAEFRLGLRDAYARTAQVRGWRRNLAAPTAGEARFDAAARRPIRLGAGLLRLRSAQSPTRLTGMGRTGHFRVLSSRSQFPERAIGWVLRRHS